MMDMPTLCNKALSYIKSISTGNKNINFDPPKSLKTNDLLDLYGHILKYSDPSTTKDGYRKYWATIITTNENIPSNYISKVLDSNIESHWNSFKTTYIDTIFGNSSNLKNVPISLTSFIVFLYLFRCFLDARFRIFKDSYGINSILLYNTIDHNQISYNINTNIIPKNISVQSLSLSDILPYLNAMVSKIITKDTTQILKTKSQISICNSYKVDRTDTLSGISSYGWDKNTEIVPLKGYELYQSNNQNINTKSYAVMKVTITGYQAYMFFICLGCPTGRILISKLDASSYPTTISDINTYDYIENKTDNYKSFNKKNWKKVIFTNIDESQHFFYIVFCKDSNSSVGNNLAHVLLEYVPLTGFTSGPKKSNYIKDNGLPESIPLIY